MPSEKWPRGTVLRSFDAQCAEGKWYVIASNLDMWKENISPTITYTPSRPNTSMTENNMLNNNEIICWRDEVVFFRKTGLLKKSWKQTCIAGYSTSFSRDGKPANKNVPVFRWRGTGCLKPITSDWSIVIAGCDDISQTHSTYQPPTDTSGRNNSSPSSSRQEDDHNINKENKHTDETNSSIVQADISESTNAHTQTDHTEEQQQNTTEAKAHDYTPYTWIVIAFQSTLFTNAGVDILCRAPSMPPELMHRILQQLRQDYEQILHPFSRSSLHNRQNLNYTKANNQTGQQKQHKGQVESDTIGLGDNATEAYIGSHTPSNCVTLLQNPPLGLFATTQLEASTDIDYEELPSAKDADEQEQIIDEFQRANIAI